MQGRSREPPLHNRHFAPAADKRKRTMKNNFITIALIIFLLPLTIFSISGAVYAQFPEMPHRFYGAVSVDGSPAGQGTSVEVYLNNEEIGSTTTDGEGKYGYSTVFTIHAQSGATLEFYVAGEKAQSYTFSPGSITNLDLTVGEGATQSEPPPPQGPAPPPPPDYSPPSQSQTGDQTAQQPPAQTGDSADSNPPADNAATPQSTASGTFNLTKLSVSPESVKPGKNVTVTAEIANSSDDSGSYTVTLMVDNAEQAEKDIELGPWEVEKVTFQVARENPGSYTVNVNGSEAAFTVTDAGIPASSSRTWAIIGVAICAALIILLSIILVRRRMAY